MPEVLSVPKPRHKCPMGGEWIDGTGDLAGSKVWRFISYSPGTVLQCECGKVWVAYKSAVITPGVVFDTVLWRKERWFERRKRLKRA